MWGGGYGILFFFPGGRGSIAIRYRPSKSYTLDTYGSNYYLPQFSSSDPSSQSIRLSHRLLLLIHCSVVRHENEFLPHLSAAKRDRTRHYYYYYCYTRAPCLAVGIGAPRSPPDSVHGLAAAGQDTMTNGHNK